MTDIYVSGPMTGYLDFNFPAFESAAAKLRDTGHRVTSPHEFGEGGNRTWSDYLRIDLIALLTHCDSVATLPGWENSRGAQLEVHVAQALGMPVRPVEEWLAIPAASDGGDS